MHASRNGRTRTRLSVLVLWMPLTALGSFSDWFVDQNAPDCATGTGGPQDPFCTIARAIAAATDGDRILIAAGRYQEHLVLDEDLELVGMAGAAVTTVAGIQLRSVVTQSAGTVVVLDGLTITGGPVRPRSRHPHRRRRAVDAHPHERDGEPEPLPEPGVRGDRAWRRPVRPCGRHGGRAGLQLPEQHRGRAEQLVLQQHRLGRRHPQRRIHDGRELSVRGQQRENRELRRHRGRAWQRDRQPRNLHVDRLARRPERDPSSVRHARRRGGAARRSTAERPSPSRTRRSPTTCRAETPASDTSTRRLSTSRPRRRSRTAWSGTTWEARSIPE